MNRQSDRRQRNGIFGICLDVIRKLWGKNGEEETNFQRKTGFGEYFGVAVAKSGKPRYTCATFRFREMGIVFADTLWFPAAAALGMAAGLGLLYRRGRPGGRLMPGFGTLYFLLRLGWEAAIRRELPLEGIPIRLDLAILAPLDFLMIAVGLVMMVVMADN